MSAKKALNITKVCEQCGKKFHPTQNSYASIARFCSVECYRQWRREHTRWIKTTPSFRFDEGLPGNER
jgi:hypothetical protein